MSRDTRLDELDAYLAEHSAAAHNVGQVELELSRAVNDYDKRTLRSERDEHLSTMHYVEHRIVALFAASLSVSPVPSEPPRISARMAKALLTLGFKGDEQGWPDYEGRTQAILVLRSISASDDAAARSISGDTPK